MSRVITLRLPENLYETVRRYAAEDSQSMNTWIEGLLDVEDMRRRCSTHEQWLTDQPSARYTAEAWADRNFDELAKR